MMMRHLLTAWQRFWFSPSSLVDLGISRIVLVAIILYFTGRTRFLRAAFVEPELWAPIALIEVLGIAQPSLAMLQWMADAALGLLMLAGLGVLARPALVLLFPLLLVQEGLLNSMGKTSHGTIPLMYALLFFAMAPCDRRASLSAFWRRRRTTESATGDPDLSSYARWPLELLFVELSAFYCLGGVAKLRAGGLAWADGYTLQYYLLSKGAPLGEWLAGHLWMCTVLSLLTLVFELGFPLAIVMRRLRVFFLVGGALFHLSTKYLMNIGFLPVVALYLLFIPWTRVGGHLIAMRARAFRAWAGGRV